MRPVRLGSPAGGTAGWSGPHPARLTLASAGLLLAACTSARLFGDNAANPPDVTKVKGSLCTSDPGAPGFPVRTLFLMDTTVADQDWIAQRGDSLEKITGFAQGGGSTFGVIRYGGPFRGTSCGLRNLTPGGFASDTTEAVAGIRCTDTANPGRDLENVLSLATSFVSGDLLTLSRGLRSRTKYVVVLFANGGPSISLSKRWCASQNPQIAANACDAAYKNAFCADVQPQPESCERYQYVLLVRQLRAIVEQAGAEEFHFHVVAQKDPDAVKLGRDDPEASALFDELARFGAGSVYRFDGVGRCNAMDSAGCLFSSLDLSSGHTLFQRRLLFASNQNALATGRGAVLDSDGDGLDDETELRIGTDPTRRDTDGDTLSDLVEVLLARQGLDPLRDDLTAARTSSLTQGAWPLECPLPNTGRPGAFPPEQDRDGDGLTDCEEALLGTDPTLFDTDGDGIPDGVEIKNGTNPLVPEGMADTDADGRSNLDEYRMHLAPLAAEPSTDGAYRTSITNEVERTSILAKPFRLPGVTVVSVSDATKEGRAVLYYTPSPPSLAYRAPEDIAPGDGQPGRGPAVPILGDGRYVLSSAGATQTATAGPDLSLTVDVLAELLPPEAARTDVLLHQTRRVCFDFIVDNVRLLPALPQPDSGQAGVNLIDLFLSEVPADRPRGLGISRAATIPIILRPKIPASTIEVGDEDLLLFGD